MASYWVIRAGEDIQDKVEPESFVGIGWSKVGHLGNLSRSEIASKVSAVYPEYSGAQTAASTGQLYRFASELSEGDIALTPIKSTRMVLIGKITGPYRHHSNAETECLANQRQVEWLRRDVSRDDLTVALKNTLGGLMTVFHVKGHETESKRAG